MFVFAESGRFIRSPSAATDALNDAKTRIGNLVTKGKDVPKEAIEHVTKFILALTEGIEKIDNEIKILQQLAATNNLKAQDLNSAYYHEYLPIKKNLRETRLKLTEYAKKTVVMSKKIRGFYDNTLIGDAKAIKGQMGALKKFLNQSIPILEGAEKDYKSAIAKIETFAPRFFDFNQEVKKMLDKDNAASARWKAEVRAGIYSSASAGTVGCIIGDALGALGKFKLSYFIFHHSLVLQRLPI